VEPVTSATLGLPWSDMFLGAHRVDVVNNNVSIVTDANGLGYLRSPAWLKRYAR